MRKKETKENGITLIALIVTIIVLLILAGITIGMLTSNNGILKKSKDVNTDSKKSKIIETAQMDILAKQSENDGILLGDELVEILTSSNYNTQGTLSDEENILDRTLTSKDGKYEIPVIEIYNGPLNSIERKSFFIRNSYTEEISGPFYFNDGQTFSDWISTEHPSGFSIDEYGNLTYDDIQMLLDADTDSGLAEPSTLIKNVTYDTYVS